MNLRSCKLTPSMRILKRVHAIAVYFRYVVTGYAGDSIVKILHDQRVTGRVHITPEHVPFIIYQLLRVLKYIHSANVRLFASINIAAFKLW